MYVAFLAAIGVLWAALTAMVVGSAEASGVAIQLFPFPWLAKFVTDAAVGIIVARLYDMGIPALSATLPRPIYEVTVSAAAFAVVGLLVAYTNGYPLLNMPISSNLQGPLAIGILLILGYGAYDLWALVPASTPGPIRALLALCASIALLLCASIAPALVLKSALADMSTGSTAAVSAWAAGITARQIKVHFRSADLEAKAAESAIPALIQREGAVVLAVLIAYIVFKLTAAPTVLFSVAVGAASSLFAFVVSVAVVEHAS